MLNRLDAATVSETEARASDRVWDPQVFPFPINPHHLTNARGSLLASGDIEPTTAPSRNGQPVTTWSLATVARRKRRIEAAAARKRLLAVRHDGWAKRGGNGHGLIGRAGEDATTAAMHDPGSALTKVTGSTSHVLGVDLIGEIDGSGYYVDISDPSNPAVVTVLVEVKNKRSWMYPDTDDVTGFLAKAAHLQGERPDQLILPLLVARQRNYMLWEEGQNAGFLAGTVSNQLVLPDHELTSTSLAEVREELGYADLILGNTPTARHLGVFAKSIPKYARDLATRWQTHYVDYLTAKAIAAASEPDA
jgi:hypothetical protein